LCQTDWEEVKEEMIEKGLDSTAADMIGNYVKMNGKKVNKYKYFS